MSLSAVLYNKPILINSLSNLPIKNQGFRPICLVYAVISTLEILKLQKTGQYMPISEKKFLKKYPGSENNIYKTLALLKDESIITDFTILTKAEQMKEWLDNKGPLISILNYKLDLLLYHKGIYKHKFGKTIGRHAVSVIGYDDNKQAWLIKNSWSRFWGNKGYGWIAYNNCSIDFLMWGLERNNE